MTYAQKAFDTVNNLLVNFRGGIVQEQHDADLRNARDEAQCAKDIAAAVAKVAARQHDVDSLKAHIKYLENELTQHKIDLKTREDRLVANANLLASFKKQRCDNNLLFVKELREHMEGIDILGLLRNDINDYFLKKSGKVHHSFIERFSEFSHLLNEQHKQIFVELSNSVTNLPNIEQTVDALGHRVDASTAQKERTAAQVGVQHVDNNKGALKKLDHVAWEGTAVYTDKLHKRVIEMIDGLVIHLKESRNQLIQNEIKAAEDFAIFQTNMEKENEHLRNTIIELKAQITDLTNQLNVSNVQLEKREKLLRDAQHEEAEIRRICREKKEYYQHESARRTGELSTVDEATKIFKNLAHLSKRVKNRANNLNAGAAVGEHEIKAVVTDEHSISTANAARVKSRNEVVF
jgi:septal ring factor EnvC (AmiA/AmiB activator)